MKLTRITITGADDAVEPEKLLELSQEFPFVEWGVLASVSRVGTARYPSADWMTRFVLSCRNVPAALHLCGFLARRAIAGLHHPDEWPSSPDFPSGWRRIQLNGFSKYRLPMLAVAANYPSTEFILQVQDNDALLYASDLYDGQTNLSALWDLSGGTGHVITWFPATGLLPMGFAGGIDPENVSEIARHVTQLGAADDPTWLDMESGVRTDDRFDLEKVRRVLDAAAPFVRAP